TTRIGVTCAKRLDMTDYHTRLRNETSESWRRASRIAARSAGSRMRLDRISQSVRTAEALARRHVDQFLQRRGANGCGSAISASRATAAQRLRARAVSIASPEDPFE